MAGKLHEYAFDVKLNAVVRVKATSQRAARDVLAEIDTSNKLAGMNKLVGDNNWGDGQPFATWEVAEFALGHDPVDARLFEVDKIPRR